MVCDGLKWICQHNFCRLSHRRPRQAVGLQKLKERKRFLLEVRRIQMPAKVERCHYYWNLFNGFILTTFTNYTDDALFLNVIPHFVPNSLFVVNILILAYFPVYGTLLISNAANQNEMPTALDAIRKMVTNSSGETHSREQQSNSVISNSGILPSTRYNVPFWYSFTFSFYFSILFLFSLFIEVAKFSIFQRQNNDFEEFFSVASTILHGGAASPAFSDISDDAPTLEKEVFS